MKNERLFLLVLASAMFTHILDFMIMMPLGPQLQEVFHLSPFDFSLLVASYSLTAGVAGFAGAFFIDRFDRRNSLLTVYIGFSIGTLACAFAPSFAVLLATRSLTGFFGGILGALILSMVSEAVPLERRAKAIGSVMASFGLASIVGVPAGLFIADKVSWHTPFLVLGSLGVAVSILMHFFIPSMTGHKQHIPNSPMMVITEIFGTRNTRLGLTFTSVLMLGHFTIIPLFATYMVGNIGLTKTELASLYLAGGACTLIFSPWVGKMADKHGRLRIFTIFGSLVIIPILIITNLSPVSLLVAIPLTAIFFIFSNGRMVPSTTMETAIINPELRGSYMSIRSSVQQLSSGIATFIAGLIVQEKISDFYPDAKALINYPYVGLIAVFFSLVSLYVATKLTVVKGA
jgi:MFS transporter, DHA1 family, inner membrane transport protein